MMCKTGDLIRIGDRGQIGIVLECYKHQRAEYSSYWVHFMCGDKSWANEKDISLLA